MNCSVFLKLDSFKREIDVQLFCRSLLEFLQCSRFDFTECVKINFWLISYMITMKSVWLHLLFSLEERQRKASTIPSGINFLNRCFKLGAICCCNQLKHGKF